MLKPFPFRALSPHHATAMNLEYLLAVIDAAKRYGYNAIQICGATHGNEGNLDGITEFVRFPKVNLVQDLEQVRANRHILREVCKAAHDAGLEVYYWHHELWYPDRLAEVYPDWFTPAPDNEFRRDLSVANGLVPRVEPDAPFWQFMDAKFDEAFVQCPELDGTIMTIQEARVPIYCLYSDFGRQVDSLVDLYKRLEAAHRRVGKKWIIRTFAWREHEYKVVAAAIEKWRPPTDIPVESKGVAMDWSLWYPYDPLLGRFEGATRHVEIAPSCEFHGCTTHPVNHPWFYTENLKFAADKGHTGAVLRIDRAGIAMLGGPDEGVLACVGAWLNDPENTDVGMVYTHWLVNRYGLGEPDARRLLNEVLENCWNATLRCYHQGKIYIGDSFWQKYDRLFFIAERHFCVEPTDRKPLAEKDEAVRLADSAATVIDDLKFTLSPADAGDLARRVRFLQLTCRTYRALVRALLARWRQMYKPSSDNMKALEQAVDELEQCGAKTSAEFPELATATAGSNIGQRQAGILVEEFARAFRKDLPNLPRRTILTRRAASQLSPNAEFGGKPAWQPPTEGKTITLVAGGRVPSTQKPAPSNQAQGVSSPKPVASSRYILVIFAGTEMCVRRPLDVSAPITAGGVWKQQLRIGQFAWFLAHDRIRRYELEIPSECFDAQGRCKVTLSAPEADKSPYISQIRLELETCGG